MTEIGAGTGMTIKLTCGDGVIVRLPRNFFTMSIFNNPEIAEARSYTLWCKARSETVEAILDMADGESQNVTMTLRKRTSTNSRTCAGSLVSGALTKNCTRFIARLGESQLISQNFYSSRGA